MRMSRWLARSTVATRNLPAVCGVAMMVVSLFVMRPFGRPRFSGERLLADAQLDATQDAVDVSLGDIRVFLRQRQTNRVRALTGQEFDTVNRLPCVVVPSSL